MDRRRNNLTDESDDADVSQLSASSIADSLRELILNTFAATTSLFTFSDDEMRTSPPEVILRRMLSTKSAISTKSSLAEANQRARDDASQQTFLQVGKGQCGTVFALKGTDTVIKLANTAAKKDELYTDLQTHQCVYQAFDALASIHPTVRVPRCQAWVAPTSNRFWDSKGALFPENTPTPNYGLLSERIFPLPLPVRAAIVDALCPKAIKNAKTQFLNYHENKSCLVRIYLGRRNDTRKAEARNVRLRNFPLHVDEMERLELDTKFYAINMAHALAILHWRANVDANDVEFVLGSSPAISGRPTVADLDASTADTAGRFFDLDFEHRTVSMWLLDFNQCKRFQYSQALNPEGRAQAMKKLVEGFWFNDPYYPRPNATDDQDKELWATFENHYLKVGTLLVAHQGPAEFVRAVVEKGKQRAAASSLFG